MDEVISELFETLKLTEWTNELARSRKVAIRRDWFNPTVKRHSVWAERQLAMTPFSTKKKVISVDSPDEESSSKEEDPNARRALLGDFHL